MIITRPYRVRRILLADTTTSTTSPWCAPDNDFVLTTASGYSPHTITRVDVIKRPLKEWMKIWAWERAMELNKRPFNMSPVKITIPEPIHLRGKRLDGRGWANK